MDLDSLSPARPAFAAPAARLRARAAAIACAFSLAACAAPTDRAADATLRAPTAADAGALELFVLEDGSASLRGLSAVSADVAWATGSGPTVARTTDGGRTWSSLAPESIEGLDVRDVHALSAEVAWIMTAGPGEASRILHTRDGGATWTEQHRETDEASFLDGFAFLDAERAVAYGDPLPGAGFRFLVTEDGGTTWTPRSPGPLPLESGEASFAASGTGIVARRDGPPFVTEAWIATGANDGRARVLRTSHRGEDPAQRLSERLGPRWPLGTRWTAVETTLPAPKPAAGAFSLAFDAEGNGVAVGGDYTAREIGGVGCASWTEDRGATWHEPETGPRGQRAGCAALGGGHFVATGQTGTDVSTDGGRTWRALTEEGFHCVEAARDGSALWFAGPRGRVGRLPAPAPPG
ncbi:MAG: oxidoreductase [Planctomycetota bacterium]